MHRGNCLIDACGEHQTALHDFNAAVKLAPAMAYAYVQRFHCLVELEQWAKALSDSQRALELGHTAQADAEFYCARGACESGQGNERSAVAEYTKALALDSEFTTAYINRADSYLQLGEPQSALADCDAALALFAAHAHSLGYKAEQSDRAMAFYNRAAAYDALHKPTHAINDYRSAIECGLVLDSPKQLADLKRRVKAWDGTLRPVLLTGECVLCSQLTWRLWGVWTCS